MHCCTLPESFKHMQAQFISMRKSLEPCHGTLMAQADRRHGREEERVDATAAMICRLYGSHSTPGGLSSKAVTFRKNRSFNEGSSRAETDKVTLIGGEGAM